jgi:M6 family metalloprotease-like protein
LLKRIGFFLFIIAAFFLCQAVYPAEGKVLKPLNIDRSSQPGIDPVVKYGGFYSSHSPRNILDLDREKAWSLPKLSSTEALAVDTVRILAMRFDFTYEDPDDVNTTGRGRYDMRDTLTFQQEEGHMIDPSPHDRRYFESHFEALNNYYQFVSQGNLVLEWTVYPLVQDSVYHLPNDMAHYGSGVTSDEIIANLVDSFFIDCFRLVDTVEAGLLFSEFDSYLLFHAGSDRQNDIGFPTTNADMFTGFVVRGSDREPLYVNSGSYVISDALIIPETASQDGRATAINAVMAHEFGHQLGLVDLYRTDNFFTQLGDFALMDNNGFGTGVDFGFDVGRAFGTMPVYPTAWSRAYLGFVEPMVYRQNADISIVAAEMIKSGVQIAKIPITDYEYYLLENRQIDIDGREPSLLADSVTSVILGPIYYNPLTEEKTFTGEYDFLLPGSGMLIWHVDEKVAALEYENTGFSRFELNRVQIEPFHRFIELVEADGLVNFGGNYQAGFGTVEDMYFEGNNTSFTPNSNPPAIGYTGANSHVYITDISVSDTTMSLSLEFDYLSDGFPRRAGYPLFGLSPVAGDVDGDGLTEIVAASDNNLLMIKEDGSNMYQFVDLYYDTSYTSLGESPEILPLLASTPFPITAGPVIGDFGTGNDSMYIAVASGYNVNIYTVADDNFDGLGDILYSITDLPGITVWMTFDTTLDLAVWIPGSVSIDPYIDIYRFEYNGNWVVYDSLEAEYPYGFAKVGDKFLSLAGDSLGDLTKLYCIQDFSVDSVDPGGFYYYGPVVADLDRDQNSMPDIVITTPFGAARIMTMDTTGGNARFSVLSEAIIPDSITANPIIADLDNNGIADIIICGRNKIYAYTWNFVPLEGFPITIDNRYPDACVVSSPVVADLDNDGRQDIVVVNSLGNCYAFGPDLLYGFPLAIGGIGVESVLLPGFNHSLSEFRDLEVTGYGSPIIYPKDNGGGLGFLGGDGWFYSYDVQYNPELADWAMNGGGPDGSSNFPISRLGNVVTPENELDQFYCYPNPTDDGRTMIRFLLERNAQVSLKFYDMSGDLVAQSSVSGIGGVPNEFLWDGSRLPSGVYRCILEANFGNYSRDAFTDIAVVR